MSAVGRGGGGGKNRTYRHKSYQNTHVNKQRNLPNACKTKDNFDGAGANAVTSAEIRMT